MKLNKKKPRQRNRPRNKANRLKDSLVEEQTTTEPLNSIQNTNQLNNIISETNISDTVISKATTIDNKDIVQKSVNSTDNIILAINEDIQQEDSTNNFDTKSLVKMPEQDAFLKSLQHQMETMMLSKDNKGLPQTIMNNLQKILIQTPISDVESSDDDDEYIEYIYKPRKYFLTTLCNWCKKDLMEEKSFIPCKQCKLSYYCGIEHLKADHQKHRAICRALVKLAEECDGHIFHKCGEFTAEQFRSYRLINIRNIESILNRTLDATERELLLFPRLCLNPKCREYRWKKLQDCNECGMIAYCKDKIGSLSNSTTLISCKNEFNVQQHRNWCKNYSLFKRIIIRQEKCGGRLEPRLPVKVLKEFPIMASKTHDIYQKLNLNINDDCEYAVLTQISTVPLTSWYAAKLSNQIQQQATSSSIFTIHLIGAEFDFEVDVLNKWELFFLHITPSIQQLNIVFVGPELSPNSQISLDQLKKTKCCRICRQMQRNVNYHFESKLYHEYCKQDKSSGTSSSFIEPNIVCFFNAGLYRATGYQWEDTWPETILAASQLKVPIVVTAYTEYEMPLDMARLVQESSRRLNVILPPIMNPFTSIKPERNFISDHEAPLMFKNFYCFIVE